jgi:hypothetical protein
MYRVSNKCGFHTIILLLGKTIKPIFLFLAIHFDLTEAKLRRVTSGLFEVNLQIH